jgi:short-subunit dehydrogenase
MRNRGGIRKEHPGRGRTLAHLVAMTQVLHEELKPEGLRLQVLCPGVVATEFHVRQGLDLSAVPRMSAEDVVTASLRGLNWAKWYVLRVLKTPVSWTRCPGPTWPPLPRRARN